MSVEESEALIAETRRLLKGTLSADDKAAVDASADGLLRLSAMASPSFPLALLAIAIAQDGDGGADTQGLRIASATYLKNIITRSNNNTDININIKDLRNELVQALLTVEDPLLLKLLIEPFHLVISKEFVTENSWPQLIPHLKSVIQNSNLISPPGHSHWKTINALTLLQALTRPFQYFLNPKVPKEPVPEQLEHVATEILAPSQATFHHFVDKVLSVTDDDIRGEYEQALLILCKSMYFAVRSYMPSAIIQVIPSICHDLLRILDALRLDSTLLGKFQMRLKIAKRCLIIFCTLITRHRKHADKLLKSILSSAINIARQSIYIGALDSKSDRIIALSFDVISHILETGPGWRLVSSHFSALLDSAIFPALSLNQKDMSEWDEDTEEYIRKNLPSELDESTGWAEDLFSARKSAINLLSTIAISKGPPAVPATSKRKKGDKNKKKQHNSSMGELLVIPFLSKFSIPSDGEETLSKTVQDYYGVLMAYGGLQDFLKERPSDYTATLIRNRVLPLYSLRKCTPYLVATSNWLLGELAPCLPQAMSEDIYNALTKALIAPDAEEISCYPIRASAAGALANLLDNEHFPSDWLSLLQVVVGRIGTGDENESSILFQLIALIVESGQQKISLHVPGIVSTIAAAISPHIPSIPDPWPQVVEKGVACLVVLVQTWVVSIPDGSKQHMKDIALVLSNLLRQAWLTPVGRMEEAVIPPPSAINDASMLLGLIIQFTDSPGEANEFKIKELLTAFADIIADYHAWEEMEDQGIFNTIKEAIYLGNKINLNCSTIITSSFIEGVSNFISEGINAYTSATLKACTCVHLLLHVPEYVAENEAVRRAIAVQFASAAFLRFKELSDKKAELKMALILAISSCYLLYPECIEKNLEQRESGGSFYWVSKLAFISSSSLSTETEAKLVVLTLAKVVDRLLMLSATENDLLLHCFVALLEVSLRLNELLEDCGDDDDDDAHETDDDDDDDDDHDSGDETDDDDDEEDTEDEMQEETEDEYLNRCAAAAQDFVDFVDEEDVDDDEYFIDLGNIDEIDALSVVRSLVKQHQVLAKGEMLSQDLINRIYETFPEYQHFFGSSVKSCM
ncbi:hypothetical protein LUZ61_016597 [Rhynchospora tenuis]|uniref:Importin N-terminal domain-containing protein n=1 Tax=Rhynchospora tenuis TaxID=198213 RepID=A0AAD5Z5U2_9POAL|nr:hypothetical protein LUZ61_016597 [Rhynchospora tenuis]